MSFKAIDSFLETLAEAPIVKKINIVGGMGWLYEEEESENDHLVSNGWPDDRNGEVITN